MMTAAQVQRILACEATEYREAIKNGDTFLAMYLRGAIVACQTVLGIEPNVILAQTAGTTAQADNIHPEKLREEE